MFDIQPDTTQENNITRTTLTITYTSENERELLSELEPQEQDELYKLLAISLEEAKENQEIFIKDEDNLLEKLDAEHLFALQEILSKMTHFTAFKINPPPMIEPEVEEESAAGVGAPSEDNNVSDFDESIENEAATSLKQKRSLEDVGREIAARNKLIDAFDITLEPDSDPWQDLSLRVCQVGKRVVTPMDVSEETVFFDPQNAIGKVKANLFRETGRQGFEAYIKALLDYAHTQPSHKIGEVLSLSLLLHHGNISIKEALQTINRLQKEFKENKWSDYSKKLASGEIEDQQLTKDDFKIPPLLFDIVEFIGPESSDDLVLSEVIEHLEEFLKNNKQLKTIRIIAWVSLVEDEEDNTRGQLTEIKPSLVERLMNFKSENEITTKISFKRVRELEEGNLLKNMEYESERKQYADSIAAATEELVEKIKFTIDAKWGKPRNVSSLKQKKSEAQVEQSIETDVEAEAVTEQEAFVSETQERMALNEARDKRLDEMNLEGRTAPFLKVYGKRYTFQETLDELENSMLETSTIRKVPEGPEEPEAKRKREAAEDTEAKERTVLKEKARQVVGSCYYKIYTSEINKKKNISVLDGIFSKGKDSIELIAVDALKQIYGNPFLFQGGIVFCNLPQGFFIRTEEDKKVLCYDHRVSAETNELTPSSKKYSKKRFPLYWEAGSSVSFYPKEASQDEKKEIDDAFLKLFVTYKKGLHKTSKKTAFSLKKTSTTDNETLDDLINDLTEHETAMLKLMQHTINGNVIVGEIKTNEKYQDILSDFTIKHYENMSYLLLSQGAVGLLELLKSLSMLKDRSPKLYQNFIDLYFLCDVDSRQFNTQKSKETIDALSQLSEADINWWCKLNEQHKARLDYQGNLNDMFSAFVYFKKELKRLEDKVNESLDEERKISLKLPINCDIKNSHSIFSSLDRLLIILNRAADPAEQLLHIGDINLDPDGACYASTNDDFFFVTGDMELSPPENLEERDLSYSVSKEELIAKGIESGRPMIQREEAGRLNIYPHEPSLSELKCFFFRYLGKQQYTHAYSKYKKLYQMIDESSLSETLKCEFASLIPIVTTGKHNINWRVNPIAYTKKTLTRLAALDNNEQQKAIVDLMAEIVANLDFAPSIVDLDNIISLVTLYPNIIEELDLKDRLLTFMKNHPQHGIKALGKLAQHHNELRLTRDDLEFMPLDDYLSQVENLFETVNDEITYINIGKILQITSCLSECSELTPLIEKLIEMSVNNKELFALIVKAMDDIHLGKSSALPSTSDLIALIDYQDQAETVTIDDMKSFLVDRVPSGKSLLFGKAELPVTPVNIKGDLVQIIDEIIEENALLLRMAPKGTTEKIQDLKAAIENYQDDITFQFINDQLNNLELPSSVGSLIKIAKNKMFSKHQSFCLRNISLHINTLKVEEVQAKELSGKLKNIIGVISGGNEERFVSNYEECNQFLLRLLDFPKKIKASIVTELLTVNELTLDHIQQTTQLLNLDDIPGELKAPLLKLINKTGEEQIDLVDNINTMAGSQFTSFLLENLLLCDNTTEINAVLEIIERSLRMTSGIAATQVIDKSHCDLGKNERLIQPLFKLLRGNLEKYLEIMTLLLKTTNPIAILQLVNAVIKQGTIEYNVNIPNELNTLIGKLSKLDFTELQPIISLYHCNPTPTLAHLNEALNNTEQSLEVTLTKFESDPYGNRNEIISKPSDLIEQTRKDKQFEYDKSDIINKISSFYDLSKHRGLSENEVLKALKDFEIIDSNTMSCSMLRRDQLQSSINRYKRKLSNPDTLSQEKREARLKLLAHLREAHYRTTGKYPYPIQILAVLHAIQNGGNMISGVDTGEGKGVICALKAAMLWAEGDTVDVCSADKELVKRDYEETKDFYTYIGAESAYLDSQSEIDPPTYIRGGINYANVSDLALYRSRDELYGPAKEEEITRTSLVLDEADHTILDDKKRYVLSGKIGEKVVSKINKDEWIYPLVNKFVDYLLGELKEEDDDYVLLHQHFPNPKLKRTRGEEVDALAEYLAEKGTPEQKKRFGDEGIADQLDKWIDSSYSASFLSEENDDFMIDTFKVQEKEQLIEKARAIILDNKFPVAGATWSDGVQQLLHARLQEKYPDKNFTCDPETDVISSSDNRDFLDYYMLSNGRILGATGSIGSYLEMVEIVEAYSFELFKIPPNEKNKRQYLPDIVAKDLSDQHKKIAKQIKQSGDQPVLVIVDTIEQAEQLKLFLENASLPERNEINTLTAENLIESIRNKKHLLEKDEITNNMAGEKNAITIATIAGRGVDIKPKHDNGLLVIDTSISTARVERQRLGRAARAAQKGTVVKIYNEERFVNRFGLTLTGKNKHKKSEIIRSCKQKLDLINKTVRKQRQMFGSVSYELDKNFDALYKIYRNEKILALKQEASSELRDAWNEIRTSTDAEAKTGLSTGQIHQQIHEIINKASKIWSSKTDELNNLLGLEPESESEPELESLTESEEAGTQDEVLSHEVDPLEFDIVTNLANRYPLVKAAQQEHNPKYEDSLLRDLSNDLNHNTLKASDARLLMGTIFNRTRYGLYQKELASLAQFKDTKEQDIFELVQKSIIDSLKKYKKRTFVAKDRKQNADKLIKQVQGIAATATDNWEALLGNINRTLDESIRTDRTSKRKASSRFRDVLTDLKSLIYSLCPDEKLNKLIKYEKFVLRDALKDELKSLDPLKYPELYQKTQSFLVNLNQKYDDKLELLNVIRYHLDTIYHDKDFNSEKSHLTNFDNNCEFLLQQSTPTDQLLRTSTTYVYQNLRQLSKNIRFNKPPKVSFFSRARDYSLPESDSKLINDFNRLFPHLQKGPEQYNAFYLFKHINTMMLENGKMNALPDSIKYERSSTDENALDITFKLMDPSTMEVYSYKTTVLLNLSSNKLTFNAPVRTGISVSQQTAQRLEEESEILEVEIAEEEEIARSPSPTSEGSSGGASE